MKKLLSTLNLKITNILKGVCYRELVFTWEAGTERTIRLAVSVYCREEDKGVLWPETWKMFVVVK
jgi:hypothetical protein